MESKRIYNPLLKEEYFVVNHKSGLEICVFSKQFERSGAVIGTRFGSINSTFTVDGGEAISVPDGSAHFLEHKLFENKDGKDSFEKYAQFGGDGNAFTSSTSTCYLFSATENLYENLEILLKTVYEPYFTVKNVQKEQGIISQEILMDEDDNESRLYYMMLDSLFVNLPVKKRIAGTVDSIMSITPDTLYKCHEAYYNPSNMILCVCGKFDIDKTIDVVDRVIGNIKPHAIKSIMPEEPDYILSSSNVQHSDIGTPMFMFGVKLKPISSPVERTKRSVLNGITLELFAGSSGKLYNDMYKENLINKSFSVGSDDSKYFSYYYFSGESTNPDLLFEKTKEYAADFKTNPPLEDEFNRIKKAFYSSNIRGFDYQNWITESYVYRYGLDDCNIFDEAEVLHSLSYQDFIDNLADFFNEERLTKAILLPKKGDNE